MLVPTDLDRLRLPADEPESPSATTDALDTADLDLALPALADAFAALHHSNRQAAVPRRIALPGQYLAFATDDGDEQLLAIDADLIHLGRSSLADIRFEDIRVSRRHAIVARYAGQVRVLDDASKTGTFLNGRPVIAANLADGDVIRLGPVVFSYVIVR